MTERKADWTVLANDIRTVDGNHDLGAGELAARLIERGWTRALPESADEGLRTRLRTAIGTTDANDGLPHWHHATGGTAEPERDGVFVDRQQVLDAIDRVLR